MNEERLEVRIRKIFDFQRFAGNARLGRLISETENRYKNSDNVVMLSDMDLERVNAAGEIDTFRAGGVHMGDQNGGERE